MLEFEALSYEWGNMTSTYHEIRIIRCSLKFGSNLDQGLRILQMQAESCVGFQLYPAIIPVVDVLPVRHAA
jgi:hypothetical protein